MLPFKLLYSDHYALPIGRHVFPATKYKAVRDTLVEQGIADESDLLEPLPAKESDILLAHSHLYVNKLMEGGLTAREELQLEIPFSPDILQSFLWHTGGSIRAAELALQDGLSFNLGGGFHHAFPDHGEGFCMIHDVAVAIRRLQQARRVRKVMVVDCDVHHGNGTAMIFCRTPPNRDRDRLPERKPLNCGTLQGATVSSGYFADVFALSVHQLNNYPFWKPPSSIDVNLPDGTGDADYLACLETGLEMAFEQFDPELICYIAGADPFMYDQLGGLSLTLDGLKRRDQFVLEVARSRGIPVIVTFAGGYARQLQDTVAIHCNTVLAAREVFAATGIGRS